MLSIFVLSDPDSTSKILLNIYSKLSKLFEEIFIYGGAFLLLFLLGIAISKYGSIKVDMPNKPIYSIYSWCSMLFAAGIGATILYWSTIEWIDYYNILKSDNLLIDYDSLLYARTYPVFHWGFTAWAIYCLPVIAFTLAITKKPNSNLTFSGILDINNFILRSILDVLFIGSIICAAGVGLGLSFPLISSVISEIFAIDRSYILDISTILLCSIIFATSAYVGVQRGIKKLSNINVIFLVIFLFLILILGPTNYIIANSYETITFYITNYIDISFTTGTTISLDWTVFYWAWWFALAPMVGTFLVNISNGKTLREIIFGTILIGSLGCTLCMLILSNLSIFLFETSIIDSPYIIENSLLSREALVVDTIASLNFGNYLLIGFVIILIIFLCTTYDSASYVLAAASMKSASVSSSKSLRLLYAILLVIQPTLLMYLNGIDSFKWIMVIFSVPLLLINLLLIFSIIKNVIRFK